jgi:hypothetical protein
MRLLIFYDNVLSRCMLYRFMHLAVALPAVMLDSGSRLKHILLVPGSETARLYTNLVATTMASIPDIDGPLYIEVNKLWEEVYVTIFGTRLQAFKRIRDDVPASKSNRSDQVVMEV